MWASLKWATWKGDFPVEVKTLGLDGAGLGKGTVKELTAGSWHRPRTALQNLVAVWPKAEIERKSWAMIGPCSVKSPWQTSSSSAFKILSARIDWRWRQCCLTPVASQTDARADEKTVSPRRATPCNTPSSVWQEPQSTACSIALRISLTILAYPTRTKANR